MVGFRDFVGTDFAPVSNKTAVKTVPSALHFLCTAESSMVLSPTILVSTYFRTCKGENFALKNLFSL